MNAPSRWQALDALFHDALAQPPEAREAFLRAACPDDPDLRDEVAAMLTAEQSEVAPSFERRVVDAAGPVVSSDPILGMRLGPWRPIAVLGHGGMGTVYLAERADGQYARQVALKLVPAVGAAGQRFATEVAALARLEHPHIAGLIDAGATPEGSPYLVMEYVDGQPITHACDQRRLGVPDRLRLFRTVCEAVQHAHQALVVHRDLKPSNIFLSRAGDVKLLDFGIAKLLTPEGSGEITVPGWHALTPAYAAPEQLRGEAVTTATDVYVLGAVLFELLTGQRPSSGDAWPATPSAAVRHPPRDGAATADTVARDRASTPARLARALSGDVDRVVLKALDPNPARRYGTAGQLADDIGRLLDGRPVAARPDSWVYRCRRFVTRHRWGVAAAAVMIAVVTGFSVVAIRQALAVAAARTRAEQQSARAERVSRLLADLFALAGPAPGRGGDVPSRELLDRGAERIASELVDDPATQAQLFTIVGGVYGNLSLHASGVAVLERALALEQRAEPAGSLAQAETLHRLGELLVLENDYRAAEARLREALTLRRRLGDGDAAVADTLVALGRTLGFRNAPLEARPLLEEAVAIRRRTPGVAPADLMAAVQELAMTFHRTGDVTAAMPLVNEAVEIGRTIAEPIPAKVEALLSQARLVHQYRRAPAEAEPVYREALALARAIYPADHQDIGGCLGELARDLRDQGRLADAEALAREARMMFQRLYGDAHRETAISTQTLAGIERDQGRLADAESTQRAALASMSAALGPTHPLTFGAMRALAGILEAQQRWSEAYALRQQELQLAVAALGERDVYVAIALTGLGEHCLAANRRAEAVGYFRRALAVRQAIHPAGHPRIDEARRALARATAGDDARPAVGRD